MSEYLNILNDSNKIVINDTFKNMIMVKKTTITPYASVYQGAVTNYTRRLFILPYDWAACDIIVIAPSDDMALINSGYRIACSNLTISRPYYSTTAPIITIERDGVPTPVPTADILGFSYADASQPYNTGIQCFNANGLEIFNSNNKYLKVFYSSGLIHEPAHIHPPTGNEINESPYNVTIPEIHNYPTHSVPSGKKYGIAFTTRCREPISYVGGGIGDFTFVEPGVMFGTNSISIKDVDTTWYYEKNKLMNKNTGEEVDPASIQQSDLWFIKNFTVPFYSYMLVDVTGY